MKSEDKTTPQNISRAEFSEYLCRLVPEVDDALIDCRGAVKDVQRLQSECFRGPIEPEGPPTQYFVNNLHFRTVAACESLCDATQSLLTVVFWLCRELHSQGTLKLDDEEFDG